MTAADRVAAICVTHNSSAALPAFVAAAQAGDLADTLRVVVVDSGSTDDTVALARSLIAADDVLELDRNRGYAAGINRGVRHVAATGGADVVVVMNPDVTLHADAVGRLVTALQVPAVGIAVPQLRDEHGNLQLSLRRRPGLATLWCDALLGGPLAHRLGLPTEVERTPERYAVDGIAAWATGGMMALSAACLDAVGPWDESYLLYDEEVDYCLRAAEAGFRVRYVASATAVRQVGQGDSATAYALMRVNRVTLLRKHRGPLPALLGWCGLVVGELLRCAQRRPEARGALWALAHRASPAEVLARAPRRPVPSATR